MGFSRLTAATADDRLIQDEVNRRIAPSGRVTLYRIDNGPEGEPGYGCVLQYETARKPIEQEYPFLDAGEIELTWRQWAENLKYTRIARWTTNPDD